MSRPVAKFEVIHVCRYDNFISSYVGLIEDNFDPKKHLFWFKEKISKKRIPKTFHYYLVSRKKYIYKIFGYIFLVYHMHKCEKIILHSIFSVYVNLLFFFMPWLLKKSYWVIWGGDLYAFNNLRTSFKEKIKEFIKSRVICNIGNLITYIEGDVKLARKWYRVRGEWHKCNMYISNTYDDSIYSSKLHDTVHVLVGNSASPSNNHIEIFEKLKPYLNSNIKIFCPLSYGDKNYAKTVEEIGDSIFGDKFISITKFMENEIYYEFLSNIDIAIFNHDRQQGMGNVITLLGMGKKVYLRNQTTPYLMLKNAGIKVYSNSYINIDLISEKESVHNNKEIKKQFSRSKLVHQWSNIFKDK